ncbi:MAG: hypothetical protein JST00_35305 [Deltaproteobacteria bacterium]|nr:hypothetical protein [Deltaproteobacteria bacterium]
MHLRAVVGRDDVVGLLDGLMPLRIELSRHPHRAIAIGRPTTLDFVPDTGVRVRTDARLVWDVAGLTVPVMARTVQLLFRARVDVTEGRHVLSLEPTLEELELERAPSFVEHRITSLANDAIERQRRRLTWDLGRIFQRGLPERVSPPTRIVLDVTEASVTVEPTSLVVHASFTPHGVREVAPPRLRAAGGHTRS